MKFSSEISKLLTDKYFLYFMTFLTATNILAYLVTNQFHAIIFFGLVGSLTHHFSKNMAIVMLVSLVTTNFLMANNRFREGLENNIAETISENVSLDNIENKDKEIAEAIPSVREAENNEQLKTGVVVKKKADKIIDMNNTDLNSSTEESSAPEGFGEKMTNKKSANGENVKPRIDYATTIEQSYQQLDQMLGSGSIQELTNDTKNLMKQQQNLFDTMQNMVPVLQGAQKLLKDFDINGLAGSLKSMGNLANMPSVSNPK